MATRWWELLVVPTNAETDVAPWEQSPVKSQHVYEAATTNVTGGNFFFGGGTGTHKLTVVDYTSLSGAVINLYINGSQTQLTEGVEWTAATSNNATASSIQSAIAGVTGLGASVSTNVVSISLDKTLLSLWVTTDNANITYANKSAGAVISSGGSYQVLLDGDDSAGAKDFFSIEVTGDDGITNTDSSLFRVAVPNDPTTALFEIKQNGNIVFDETNTQQNFLINTTPFLRVESATITFGNFITGWATGGVGSSANVQISPSDDSIYFGTSQDVQVGRGAAGVFMLGKNQSLRLQDNGGTPNHITLTAPTAVTSSYTATLPAEAPIATTTLRMQSDGTIVTSDEGAAGAAAWESVAGNFQAKTTQIAAGDRYYINSRETDGASQIGTVITTSNSFTTSGAKLLSVDNAGTEKFDIDKDGTATSKRNVVEPFGASAGQTGEIRLLELAANGTNYAGIKAADSISSSLTYVWPSAAPASSGYVLSSTTGGTMSWVAQSGGGGNVYESMTDGTTTSTASGSTDTFKFRSASNLLSVAVTNDDVTHGDNLLLTVNEANITLANLSGYDANQHVDHTGVTLTAGSGLSGGGDISTNRTFNVDIASETETTTPDETDWLLTENNAGGTIRKVKLQTVVNPAPVTLSDAATISVNAALGNHFRVTLGGNRTLGNPTNGRDGQKITFEVIQDGTGSRTLSYDTQYAFGTDITSTTLTTTANKRDFIGCIYNNSESKWYIVSFIKGY